ncbi:DegT/DnrJ/EryC1/StrS family aminotransferase [Azospirillum sp. TSO22-1]|uniref:DegT/DnrJ/EryC1/StrS family aminotransferase n=1 Tax=Azospirillum sp. TSO22-1 TaxID=716789 RepID=UPI000D610349|nr:DegT/DnrJ/EryC1/StrS family aminotransferase [Azospirillum sp. TSO22-1]PWC55333.1 aminotransferase DegT [Azospirillum sp. TSO22-1]
MDKTAERAAALSDNPGAGPVPFIDLAAQRRRLGSRIEAAMNRVLEHGQFIMGPEIKAFETQLAAFCGAKHAISCSSGTDSLQMVLMAWGVGRGDAVFVPTFTFASTAEVVAILGATPVFCDVLPDTFNMDPASLEAAIGAARAAGLTPRAVIPVDLFGQPADYRRIEPVARAHGLKLLADAAQSFGAELDGRKVGTIGDAASTSFFPAKPLGCYGDGGAILTDDDELAEALRSIRVHGKGSHKYDNARVGMNGRLDTLQAAVLIEKLSIFADEVAARQRIGRRYNERLEGIVAVPALLDGATSVWAQYTVKAEDAARRDALGAALKAAGIPTAVYYPLPLHRQTAYRGFPAAPGGLPVSDALADQVISLPMHPYLDEAVQDRIVAAVAAARKAA